MNNKQQPIEEASTSQYIRLRIFTETPADRENLTALCSPIIRTGQICYTCRYRTRPLFEVVSVSKHLGIRGRSI